MGISLALGATAIAGGVASYSASKKSAQAAKDAAKQQNALAGQEYDLQKEYLAFLEGSAGEYAENAERLLAESRGITEDAYGRIVSIINAIPRVNQLFGQAEKLSRRDFDFRTGIKRENLDFILGDTDERLREIQSFSADLANLEEGAFTGRFSKIIKSNMLGLKALTVGEPTGSFANLSARNLYDFSNKALSNYLQLNDFIAREGTVDPISPYTISQDLFSNEFNIAGTRINNEQFRARTLVDINAQGLGVAAQNFQNAGTIAQAGMGAASQYFDTLRGNAGINAAADAQQAQGFAQLIGSIGQGLGTAYGMYNQNQALGMQKEYQQALINNLNNSQSVNSFAPRTIPVANPVIYGVNSNPAAYTGSAPFPSITPGNPSGFYGYGNVMDAYVSGFGLFPTGGATGGAFGMSAPNM